MDDMTITMEDTLEDACATNEVAWYSKVFLEHKLSVGTISRNFAVCAYGVNEVDESCEVAYIRDIEEANKLIDSTLFRPPHGLMGWSQMQVISKHYNIIMYDLVTRDYDRSLSSERIFKNVKRYARNGSIIVFHDSLKSLEHIKSILPCSIEWLKEHGYEMLPIPM